jgi:hypothetical protein
MTSGGLMDHTGARMFDQVAGERDEAWLVTALRRRWWVVILVGIIALASA